MAAADLAPGRLRTPDLGRFWLVATIVLTLAPMVGAVVFAPASGTTTSIALVSILFIGSSVHIGATAWFYTVPEVRAHMARHRVRYVMVPLALMVAGAVIAGLLSPAEMTWVLLAFFGWQFFHFQKQNLGLAALATQERGIDRLSTVERRALTLAGVGGTVALLGRPELLDLDPRRHLDVLFAAGLAVFGLAVLVGLIALSARARSQRTPAYVVVYLISLLFFVPVFLFSSPYAAVAGMTVAHGLQYLLLVGLLAAAPQEPMMKPLVGVLILANLALVVGLLLNRASHLHDGGPWARAVFGVYLGVLTAHFVIDAGLWRLRDEFPRAFLSARLPYLLTPVRR